ncbi:hypothetical protein PHYBLDRAFT_187610 [Phycomyces blakesleeanus NRRL 1555(-)]|uniref:Uncharacterized protein n=1 Tax=Phycomyces blakesleeanus (strain ATCC 8743b / DSM 1359 / FGSC 10004 / NBRC 33097 / NRRL 1555) TaxID=763407 RepID=A0A162N6E0_PHYB8|nr:hypothetical protein PHYBLDRAFT_187610 [Phycomyces blakesleeanus NRRL 1555(-)]OAD71598.1 hypothetical protein PHYBLDRAFT_187610 [Phycomyces blakesleeanus NRRL 1555(-)]|eukprot:XP_018289638.1 hypothetical protein PHYBLDRAFT_187610 [Phycomyces blakesleeanus NRRL 1555(-)]
MMNNKNDLSMSSSNTHTLFCIPKSQPDDELNAFDLTWRNYLPSMTQLCPCFGIFKGGSIQLDDDDESTGNLGPHYYNDQSIYQGRTIQGYLRNSRDREFESVLENGGGEDGAFSRGDYMPSFVTRNPFGRNRRKRPRRRKERAHLIQEEHDEPAVYEIFSEEQDRVDAESLGDDQIANLVFKPKTSDQYDEELYITVPRGGPKVQEMFPPTTHPGETTKYGLQSTPYLNDRMEIETEYDEDTGYEEDTEYENYRNNETDGCYDPDEPDEVDESDAGPVTRPTVAQTMLTEQLDDLTEKLVYIKRNIMDIGVKDSKVDPRTSAVLRPLKHLSMISNSERAMSDLDSIASEALEEYGNVVLNNKTISNHTAEEINHSRLGIRKNSGASDFNMPLADNHSTPFGSDQHPFTYFERSPVIASQTSSNRNSLGENQGLNVHSVFEFGKKWLNGTS